MDIAQSLTKLDYARQPRQKQLRRLLWPVMRVLLILTIPLGVWVLAKAYVDHQYGKLTLGMTRIQVDRQLWAFASYAEPGYGGLTTGQFVIRYELLHMGKETMIQIIFNPDGTAADVQPIYDLGT
jgi:hypothetical protein